MEEYNPDTLTNNANSFTSDSDSEKQNTDNKEVIAMNENQTQKEKSNESAAFEQVMAQLNIADIHTFNTHYEQLWFQASENKEMLSIMICEIDSFNEYNEHYGHQATSFMLVLVALELKKKCEEFGGFLARYKTGKFAVLIKKGNIKTVEKMAESLRQSIEQTNTEHKASKISDVVTLSIGTSNIYPTSMDVLINKADTALQSSKLSGNKQTILPFAPEAKVPDITTAIPSRLTEEPLKQVIPIQKNVQTNTKPELIEIEEEEKTEKRMPLSVKRNGLRHEEFDMISQLKGITPIPEKEVFQEEEKTTEKLNLFSRLKNKMPLSKQSNTINDEQPSNEDEIAPSTPETKQDKEKSEYDHLKQELEALKRKSESPAPAPTAPIRYY